MRKLLLLALLFSGMITRAQTSITDSNCKAQFKYEINTQVMTLAPAIAFNFYDRSEGNVNYWFWDFGDGSTSEDQNPLHIFNPVSIPGPTGFSLMPYRVVSLTILTSDSCKSFYSDTIRIMDDPIPEPTTACKARFKYYQSAFDSVSRTATFQMTNLSEGDSLSFSWNFDNQETSTETEPSVTFNLSQPERKVCLTVSGPNGCSDTFCDAVYVSDPQTPADPADTCFAYIGYVPNYSIKTFAPALVLDFYAKGTPDAVEWKWDFGDGTTSDEANPTHIFNYPLTVDSILGDPNPFREVNLTVKTASGCIATASEKINIYMDPGPIPEPGIQCHAWFKYYRPIDVISIPEVVPFRLVDASEGKVISRLWQFEDGTTSTDPEVQVTFDIFKPTQKVCLTIVTADSCSSTWCDIIYVSPPAPDTTYTVIPSGDYAMHFTSSFPAQMSSCAGYAKAQVYLKDSIIEASNYAWSTGETGQEIKGLCPTQTYTVKATTPDGNIVSGSFVFNSDGTVTEIPVNWWISGNTANPYIRCAPASQDLTVEWRLCDGTIVSGDSIALNDINCGDGQSNLILKDVSGNVVYSENISLKTLVTGLKPGQIASSVKIYPNPVKEVLNIQYAGKALREMQIKIFDVTGKNVSGQQINQVEPGQNISVNVNSLKKGIYLCKLIADNQILTTQKFIK